VDIARRISFSLKKGEPGSGDAASASQFSSIAHQIGFVSPVTRYASV